MTAEVRLPATWKAALAEEFAAPYMLELRKFLVEEMASGRGICPAPDQIFRALWLTELPDVRVVILGQDPYHGEGQAHGLSFSVREGVKLPPSLRNIYAERETDVGVAPSASGDLTGWAKQGVLLLNAVLTVEPSRAGSHAGRGWERLTDAIVAAVSGGRESVVFVLWGKYAQRKGAKIDRERHCVLTAPHPSPLSAHRGFFGSRPFSQANAWLRTHGRGEIMW